MPAEAGLARLYIAGQEPAGKGGPDQDTDGVILGERLELVFETPADEAVVHLRRYVFLQLRCSYSMAAVAACHDMKLDSPI